LDSDKNVCVTGYGHNVVSPTSNTDLVIKKFDSNGVEDITHSWPQTFDGGSNGAGTSVAAYSTGNVYVVGYGNNLVSGSSGLDWVIKKYSSNGIEDIVKWDKTFDGGSAATAQSLAIGSNGNVYVVGYGTNLVGSGTGEDWVIKSYNSDGVEDTLHWNKTFDGGANARATSVAIDSKGYVYVAGYGTNLVNGTSGTDWMIKKYH
jgi:hypothetical protein